MKVVHTKKCFSEEMEIVGFSKEIKLQMEDSSTLQGSFREPKL